MQLPPSYPDGRQSSHPQSLLKHRDEQRRLASRRSSVSSSAGSVFSDSASVLSSASSNATSISSFPPSNSDTSETLTFDGESDEGELVQAQHGLLQFGQAHPVPSTSAGQRLDCFPAETISEGSSHEFNPKRQLPGLDAHSTQDEFRVPNLQLPMTRWLVGQQLLQSEPTTLPIRLANEKSDHGIASDVAAATNAGYQAHASAKAGQTSKHQEGQFKLPINPRRSASNPIRAKPTLVRQEHRRMAYVEQLVDVTEQMIAFIWPMSRTPVNTTSTRPGSSTICLRFFIREVLKRSRTSHSTLQVALYYCYLIWKSQRLPAFDGRRMFLSSLMLAYKYLQDRNFSTHAWSSISSLPSSEIKVIEVAFLRAVDYRLFIKTQDWDEWRIHVELGLWHARQGLSCPWKMMLSGMLKFQTVGGPSLRSKTASSCYPPAFTVAFDNPTTTTEELVEKQKHIEEQVLGHQALRGSAEHQSVATITPPWSPEHIVSRTTNAAAAPANGGMRRISTMPATPTMSALTSPDSPMDKTIFHTSAPLGRLVHGEQQEMNCGASNREETLSPQECPSLTHSQESTVSSSEDDIQQHTLRSRADCASRKSSSCHTLNWQIHRIARESEVSNGSNEGDAVKTPISIDLPTTVTDSASTTPSGDVVQIGDVQFKQPYGWLEQNYSLVEDHEDQVARRLEWRSKNKIAHNMRRKRSIRTSTAGHDELPSASRTKVPRCRRH